MASKVPLDKLIGVAITNKNRFEDLMNEIEKSLDEDRLFTMEHTSLNVEYVRHKLNDIILHQFPEQNRYLIELVQNSLDAHSSRIDIEVQQSRKSVKDNGDGMSLTELGRNLSVPFYTEKDGVNTIGQFGLGFFSTLKELYAGNFVKVSTKKDSGYTVTYTLDDGTVKAKFERNSAIQKGTAVEILPMQGSIATKGDDLVETAKTQGYLSKYLKYVPSRICDIRFNGGKFNTGPKRYTQCLETYEIPFRDSKIFVALNFDVNPKEAESATLVGGIKVEDHNYHFDFIVSLPTFFKVTEGRDKVDAPKELLRESRLAITTNSLIPYMNKYENLAGGDERFDNFVYEIFSSSMITEYIEKASYDELKRLVEFRAHKKIPKKLIIADKNLRYLLSDFHLVGDEVPLSFEVSLRQNPNILKFEGLPTTRARYDELNRSERARLGLEPNLSEYNIAFLQLSQRTFSPYGVSVEPKLLYINKNHMLFDLDSDYARLAKRWFLSQAIRGSERAEYRTFRSYFERVYGLRREASV